jgi:hypothetical protein
MMKPVRALVVIVGAIGAILAVIVGLLFIPIGIFEQRDADAAYVVVFGRSGEDCPPNGLVLSASNGKPLSCVQEGMMAGPGGVNLTGFTQGQTTQVTGLARELGSDGLSDDELRQVQELVDRYAAQVPAGDRPYADAWLWGVGRTWTGVAMIVVGLLAGVLVVRRGIDWI